MDAAVIGCRHVFVHHSIKLYFCMLFGAIRIHLVSLQLSVADPIALKVEDQHLNLGGFLRSKQAISILYIVVVVKDTVFMVLGISYLKVVSASVDLHSNGFIGAMADLIPQVLVPVVNGDTFQLQTFNNKDVRNQPMTQPSMATGQVRSIAALLYYPSWTLGKGKAVLVISHCVYGSSNMLDDDDTCGSNKFIGFKNNAGGWSLLFIGTHSDIGSTKQDLIINEPYNETAAAQYGWDEREGGCLRKGCY
ncbi:hypothetical protein O0I10_007914 [Lichtheimia ornata]|uniref:Uncharacterized protein n=1 Tax=Lichtheimia ornata TaxID=688661 RepID=A0AAD7UZ81_9FUNG|nr:uncharacterized protein O0I10_007914 [Lichtheimia ornata]KAJ8656349.1 hypothetical protein O0I10_007914 [Lichtheimia ornata]